MPTVMTKYRYNDNNFLVYDTNLLQNKFSVYQLQRLAQDIETDYIVIFNSGKISFYTIQGDEISADMNMEQIALYHQAQKADISIIRKIEVRFTNSYINRIMNKSVMQSRIA